ncbi:hypothetical protein ACHAQC_002600 [Fusarium culmorum]
MSTSSRTITAYTTTSTIQAPAGFTPAKGPDWRPKIKARDSLNTLKERAAVELFPAGLQSNPEYVQRVDCTKKVPSHDHHGEGNPRYRQPKDQDQSYHIVYDY